MQKSDVVSGLKRELFHWSGLRDSAEGMFPDLYKEYSERVELLRATLKLLEKGKKQ